MHDDSNDDQEGVPPVGPPRPCVGYKMPPEPTRFKKGQSGNPKGRPKNATDKRAIAKKVLLEEHEIVEGDRKVRYSTLELALIALRNRAFEGNNRAFKAFERLDADYDPQKPAIKSGRLVVPGRLTKAAWVKLFSPPNDPTQKSEGEDE